MSLIHGLHFNNLRGGIFGGVMAAVVALPLALALESPPVPARTVANIRSGDRTPLSGTLMALVLLAT